MDRDPMMQEPDMPASVTAALLNLELDMSLSGLS